jgi:hypothetical protein
MQNHSIIPKNILFSLPATVIYAHIYGHVGRRITVTLIKFNIEYANIRNQ